MTTQRNKYYKTVRVLIISGQIKQFHEIFNFIPKTAVIMDLGMNFNRFNNLIQKVENIKVSEMFLLAELFEVDYKDIIDIVVAQCIAGKKRKKAYKRKKPN